MLLANLDRRQQKIVKKFLKDEYKKSNRRPRDVLDNSLLEESRLAYPDDDWETCIEFGYLSNRTDLTDEEIEEICDDMTLRIYSLYDCTGLRFTRWITTHRNPSGLVSFVHYMGLDV